MKHYKIVVFGIKETTRHIVTALHEQGIQIDLIISINPHLRQKLHLPEAIDLAPIAKQIGADYYCAQDYHLQHDDSFFNRHQFSLGIAYGWQRLIPSSILNRFSNGIFGFHASPNRLPKGRGHSPLNWSLILGKKKLYNHFFKYNTIADTGDIYSITPFSITPNDTILTLSYKSLLCAQREIPRLVHDIERGLLKTTSQHHPRRGYLFPRRTLKDGLIDFSHQTTLSIVNLIRGTTFPFPGAYCFLSTGERIILWEAWAFDSLLDFSLYLPGTVISCFYQLPVIKTIDGTIIVKKYTGIKLKTGMLITSEAPQKPE